MGNRITWTISLASTPYGSSVLADGVGGFVSPIAVLLTIGVAAADCYPGIWLRVFACAGEATLAVPTEAGRI